MHLVGVTEDKSKELHEYWLNSGDVFASILSI